MYHDFRTGGHTFSVIMFDAQDGVPTSYSPEFFAEHSEHVTLIGDSPYVDAARTYMICGTGREPLRTVTGWAGAGW